MRGTEIPRLELIALYEQEYFEAYSKEFVETCASCLAQGYSRGYSTFAAKCQAKGYARAFARSFVISYAKTRAESGDEAHATGVAECVDGEFNQIELETPVECFSRCQRRAAKEREDGRWLAPETNLDEFNFEDFLGIETLRWAPEHLCRKGAPN